MLKKQTHQKLTNGFDACHQSVISEIAKSLAEVCCVGCDWRPNHRGSAPHLLPLGREMSIVLAAVNDAAGAALRS